MRSRRYPTRYITEDRKVQKQLGVATKCLKTVKQVMYANPELFNTPIVGKHIAALMDALYEAETLSY